MGLLEFIGLLGFNELLEFIGLHGFFGVDGPTWVHFQIRSGLDQPTKLK